MLRAMTTERPPEPSGDAGAAKSTGIYVDFDAFLKQALREYYDRGWTTRKGNFIALLIASGSTSLNDTSSSTPDLVRR